MDVMNSGDYEQKNVLVGQAGKTQAFGVTNDPILMGMLSTGLYGNPLRTMTQEVIFNAWDAHRMGNCQDKPIDIYINDTSGLIIRDYGPGISPDEIHPIYCIYGNSTKRQDNSLTGGFGLGSKSPYAYTDSFTVTSHHGKQKSMYMMNRVSEENNGGPGMTPIIQGIPTDETGLMVTIPMKSDRDMLQTYEYIKDILLMSGVKANIHYKDEDPELVESETVQPGEWKIQEAEGRSKLFAMYGGVRYEIPSHPHYVNEWNFVQSLARILGNMYIGFKPSSLTPLPNREGLNLNEQTLNNIKIQLEIMEESFNEILVPIIRVAMLETLKELSKSQIQTMFIAERWNNFSTNTSLAKLIPTHPEVLKKIQLTRPHTVNESSWNSLASIAIQNTDYLIKLIGHTKFYSIKFTVWAKIFPKELQYKASIAQRNPKSPLGIEQPQIYAKLIKAQTELEKELGFKVDLKVRNGRENFATVTNIRSAGMVTKNIPYRKETIIKKLGDKLKTPSVPYPDRLWYVTERELVEQAFLKDIVIIAKTAGALKDTHWNVQKYFCKTHPNVTYHHPYHIDQFYVHHSYRCNTRSLLPAFVVHDKKGSYEKALNLLKQMGYEVLEADLPVKRVRAPKVLQQDGTLTEQPIKVAITYPLYDRNRDLWQSDIVTEEPTCWMKVTATDIKGYYPPDKVICEYVKKHTPRLVVINSDSRIPRLLKMEVPRIQEFFEGLVLELLESPDLKTMMLYHHTYSISGLSENLVRLPEVAKYLGLPYIRTSQMPEFLENSNLLRYLVSNDSYYNRSDMFSRSLYTKVKEKLNSVNEDPSLVVVRERCKKLKLLDEKEINGYVQGMKPHELKSFSEKLLRFARTV